MTTAPETLKPEGWTRREVIGDCRKRSDGSVAIYALCDGPDDRIRYVGKTSYYMHVRHKQHIRAAEKGDKRPVSRWIRKQIKRGNWLTIKLLEYVPDGGDWAARERDWIKAARSQSADCLNLCDGGEGVSGIKMTSAQRERIAAALRKPKIVAACEKCGERIERKKSAARRHCFCSRDCYQSWQRGRSKASGKHMGAAGREAAAAKKRAQTHCKRGHALSGENLHINPRGARICKTCSKEHSRAYRARNG